MITSRAFISEWQPHGPYCEIAAAILGAGALSAGASIWGSSNAANAQTQASQAAIANSNNIFGQVKGAAQPYIDAGTGALGKLTNWTDPNSSSNPLSSLIKLVTPGADQSATLAQTPGYQFAQGQGTRGVLNALAARGLGGSTGPITTGVGNFVTGLAGNTWDSVVKNLLATFGSGSNALQGIVNAGGTGLGTLGNAGNTATTSINSAITGAGNAQAAASNAQGAAIGSLGSSLSTAAIINQLTGQSGNSVYGSNGQVPATGVGQYS
jgi:hypothetical protein